MMLLQTLCAILLSQATFEWDALLLKKKEIAPLSPKDLQFPFGIMKN